MVGTKIGGLKAKQTNYAKHGRDFYAKIGQVGGRRSCNGGFASNKIGPDGLTGYQRARIVGAKGGKISRRGPRKDAAEVSNV